MTTTMSYCTQQNGMNQPLTIQPTQVTSNPPPETTGNINPTLNTPGFNYPSMYPEINVTLVQPATLTLIYIPVDRQDRPSNVNRFIVKFVYPDSSTTSQFSSEIPSTTETTISSGTTTTLSTTVVFPPSDASPRVNLPPNFHLPNGTIIVIDVRSTVDYDNPKQVTVGIVACVEVTATTATTIGYTTPGAATTGTLSTPGATTTGTLSTPGATTTGTLSTPGATTTGTLSTPGATTTGTLSTPGAATTSGTTIIPTSVHTSTMCRMSMAQPEGVYVSYVNHSGTLLPESGSLDYTTSGTGFSFQNQPNTIGLFDNDHRPLYYIDIVFNPAGADSLSSIMVNNESNVNGFRVEFFVQPGKNQLFTIAPYVSLSYNSTMSNAGPSISNFLDDVPSPLTGVRISILSTRDDQPPHNLKLAIFGCFNTPIIETTTTGRLPTTETSVTPVKSTTAAVTTSAPGSSTGTPASSTTVLPPITTTMSYCTQQNGMNQPLTIQPTQVTSNPPPETTGNINPTLNTPGFNYPSMYPEINVTLVQPATLTLIYIPVDRQDRPSNVNRFIVKFVYPDSSTTSQFSSEIPSTTETTISSGTTTTLSTTVVFPPSDASPRVNLPPNFHLPNGTIIVVDISGTVDGAYAKEVTIGIVACTKPVTPSASTITSTIPFTSLVTASELPTTSGTPFFTTINPVSITSIKCIYSDWTNWTSCTVTCGQGQQMRARNAMAGSCTEPLLETRICQMEPCPCIFTQDIYISTFQKLPPVDNFVGWIEKDDQTGYTNSTESVYIGDHLDNNTIVHSYNCSEFICKDSSLVTVLTANCSKDCQFEPWTEWTSCNITCGGNGNQTRSRGKIPAAGNGTDCIGSDIETLLCSSLPCVGACLTTEWTDFTPCSKSCGLGSQIRTRNFTSQQPNCTDSLIEVRDCNIGCCSVDGNWSPWSPWNNCTADCNGGERVRTRQCNQPTPQCDGAPCGGASSQAEPCNTLPCTNGTCTGGKVLSNCSNSCDTSCSTLTCNGQCSEPEICQTGCICANDTVMDANGNCVMPSACQCMYNGRILLAGQTINVADTCQKCTCQNGCVTCNSVPCIEQCTWSNWSPFGECSAPCNGTESRYQILQGSNCYHNDTKIETRPCSTVTSNYQKGCATCTCLNLTNEECVTNCGVTNETCSQIEDPLFTYIYTPPVDGLCCGSCIRVPKPEICSINILPADFVTIDNCTSTEKISQQQCLGGCISYSMSGFSSPQNNCRCCAPATTSTAQVKLICTDSSGYSTTIWKPYKTILTCSCSACENTIPIE
ncbi:unnamed protein product [Rotaria socialis]